ncbi:MAG: PilZ domain-containing protein [Gemmatimonadetes bacterium]|nr:MAG: PilZ domain-containing protein [Gemmatimonadota bacterium]
MKQGFPSEELRRYYRLDSEHLVNFETFVGEDIIEGLAKTENISSGGILLRTTMKLEAQQELRLQLSIRDELIRARGLVARCFPVPGTENDIPLYDIAVRFTDLDRHSRSVIGHLIAGTMVEQITAEEEV